MSLNKCTIELTGEVEEGVIEEEECGEVAEATRFLLSFDCPSK
jgi:hypothetical protein